MQRLLDIVIPAYNESQYLAAHIETILPRIAETGMRAHIILVDDGSTDDTWSMMQALAASYPEITALQLARNYGQNDALFAGLAATKGDAVITMDADGQHPPRYIPEMVARWQEGAKIVHGRKRQTSYPHFLYQFAVGLFHRLLAATSGMDVRGASEFKLLDRSVLPALLQQDDGLHHYRFAVPSLDFPAVDVMVDVPPSPRPTRYSLRARLLPALRILLYQSGLPKAVLWLVLFASIALGMLSVAALSIALLPLMLVNFGVGAASLAGLLVALHDRRRIGKPRDIADIIHARL